MPAESVLICSTIAPISKLLGLKSQTSLPDHNLMWRCLATPRTPNMALDNFGIFQKIVTIRRHPEKFPAIIRTCQCPKSDSFSLVGRVYRHSDNFSIWGTCSQNNSRYVTISFFLG